MPISVAGPRSPRGIASPLAALIRGTLALERRRAGAIGVLLSDDRELRALNRRYRKLDRATDVLSFGYDEEGAPVLARGRVEGDLVISMDRVAEQARRFRVTEARELARLVIHGTLHLAGLDHGTPAERLHMRAREERALRAGRTSIAALARVLDRAGD